MTNESDLARHWRDRMGLSRQELAALTGYGKEAIYCFERGVNSHGQPHAPEAWQRYKLACLAAHVICRDGIETWDWA